MKLAVTGGHGFLGSHVTEAALAAGADVRVVASPWGTLERLDEVDPEGARLEVVRADVTDLDAVRAALRGCDAVVHAAALVTDHGRWRAFDAVNVRGSANVARAATELEIDRVVLLSSVAVWRYVGIHGDDPRTRPRDRTRPGYGASKRLAEDAVLAHANEPVIVRPALWPYGRRDPVLPRVVATLRRGALPLLDGGRARLQTVDARWLGRVIVAAATRPEAAGRSYLVADAGEVTWDALLSTVAQLVGAPAPRLRLPGAPVRWVAPLIEAAWTWFSLPGDPIVTRYRAELMRGDVVFGAGAVEAELGLAPDRDRDAALRDALASFGALAR